MDKNRLATRHYCPACGEQSYTPLPVILPGQYDWKCPKCGERFRIDIGFYEKEEGDAITPVAPSHKPEIYSDPLAKC